MKQKAKRGSIRISFSSEAVLVTPSIQWSCFFCLLWFPLSGPPFPIELWLVQRGTSGRTGRAGSVCLASFQHFPSIRDGCSFAAPVPTGSANSYFASPIPSRRVGTTFHCAYFWVTQPLWLVSFNPAHCSVNTYSFKFSFQFLEGWSLCNGIPTDRGRLKIPQTR